MVMICHSAETNEWEGPIGGTGAAACVDGTGLPSADCPAPERTVQVAVSQFAAEPGDVAGNVARLEAALRRHGPAADLFVAPELATTGYDLQLLRARGHDIAEPADGASLRRLVAACVQVRTTLVTGFLERAGGRLYDSVLTATPDGRSSVYRKTHLYLDERTTFAAGDRLQTATTPAGVLGPLLCFEHAFPEIATTLALAGAQILVICSAVPVGYEHLLALRTRARAQDNQVFAVACNMTGHGFCGGSLVAGPRGDVTTSAGTGPAVLSARLDLGDVARQRRQEPALRLRRPELYRVPGSGA